jgi:hypothetical protein
MASAVPERLQSFVCEAYVLSRIVPRLFRAMVSVRRITTGGDGMGQPNWFDVGGPAPFGNARNWSTDVDTVKSTTPAYSELAHLSDWKAECVRRAGYPSHPKSEETKFSAPRNASTEIRISDTATASRFPVTCKHSRDKVAGAPFVGRHGPILDEKTYISTTTTPPARCAGYSATLATWGLATSKTTRTFCYGRLPISKTHPGSSSRNLLL